MRGRDGTANIGDRTAVAPVSEPKPLAKLLAGVEGVALEGDPDTLITGIVLDSRRVGPDALFAALPGALQDGMSYLEQALRAGAAAVLSPAPRPAGLEGPRAWLWAVEPRKALALIARNFHGRPDEKITALAVTGTNGKTTVATLIAEILRELGLPCGLIGTVAYRIGEREQPAERTTPEAPDLYRMLEEMTAEGCQHVVLEASSHGLALERVGGLSIAVAIFTNLTRDHLDFHGDIDSYAAAKRRLFSERLDTDGVAIAGGDDPRASWMLSAAPPGARRSTFGFSEGSDYRIESCGAGFSGTDFAIRTRGGHLLEGRTPLPGRPGVLNLAAAIAAVDALGLDPFRSVRAAARFPGVPGRFERIDRGQDFAVVVDYAHTDDALASLLSAVREMRPRRLITVFGCGGNRDRSKRAPMGSAAIRLSDLVFLTSDNPRGEDPGQILLDAEEGILSDPTARSRYGVLPDRREAIHAAIATADAGDAVVIAGKGHERVQILADRTIPFDDRTVAAEALELRAGIRRS